MLSKKLRSLIVIGFAIASIATTGIALAATSDTTTPSTTAAPAAGQGFRGHGGRGGGRIDKSSLVTKGIIDQATADKITAYMQTEQADRQAEMDKVKAMTEAERQAYFEANKTTREDYTSKLVSAGIITQTQADAIKAEKPAMDMGKGMDRGFGKIDVSSLVSNGTIDQATADKVTAYMESKATERQAEMDKVKAMTETERQAYFEANKDKAHTDFFADMVTAGILTQTQADAMKAAMPERTGGHGRGFDVTSLVTNGTIDQATADKMTAFMESKKTERQAEMDKVKAMTETERQAYFEANKSTQRVDCLSEMVSANIITQAQADAIKAAMPQRPTKTAEASTAAVA